ncbi:unnamed protein product (macronuclear) [Paramecium tetraurelia]|uniref:Uncharacterized protein n=1 Tax=Paramecium tetraurelia TaxID=5888 RepID=A0CJU7_PARTE|nr:uncharacterized protein GSPATT00000776001 [Paramecium tetraurelia]CAK71064.1 unnamed protein product [Paramecium tetraurelia]|eukprot:XP_001438461.1 hypothetical protein (macronuclear) [Paramecium tetraurelia strain d4-2]
MKIIYRLISYCYLWLPKKLQKTLQKTLFQQQENEQIFKVLFIIQSRLNFRMEKSRSLQILRSKIINQIQSAQR